MNKTQGNFICIRTINYIPSFRKIHNEVRSKCLILLYAQHLTDQRGLKLAELVELGNFNYKSVSVLLTRWINWRYIGYCSTPEGREYHILRRGRDWFDRWQEAMPLERYIRELEDIQGGGKG